MKRLSVCIALALSLTSCTAFFTDYKSPEFPKVDSFANAAKYTGGAIENDFYKNFNDEKLNFVIEKALEHNYDMRTAYINVEKALLNVDITDTNYHPTAEASLGSNSKRALDRHDSSVKSSTGKFSLSYQLDLFGKLKAQSDEALHNYEATAYDYLAMRLTIIETTAKAYWQYSYAKEAVVLGEEDLVDSEKRLKLVENKYLAGAADSLDLDDARINHLKVKNTLDVRRNQLEKARTALMVITGSTPDGDYEISALDATRPPKFSLDVPAKLLEKRPDLKKDEALLKKMYSVYNQREVAFFPDFTLQGSISSGDSGTFGRFLSNPVGTLGAAATLPFLNFNKLSKEKQSALKDVEIEELNFVKDYINAVQEVYDCIYDVSLYRKNLRLSRQTYQLSERNYQRYFERYSAGLVDLNDFLTASDTMRNARISFLEAKRNNLTSMMSLMTALGGDNRNQIEEIVK